MTYRIFSCLAAIVILVGCALPAMTVRIPPVAAVYPPTWTPVDGGPPQATAEAEAEATAEAVQEESTPEPEECLIKGNTNRRGERIYHVPGSPNYDQTVVDISLGERWFCTEQEALDAGWRKAGN